MAQSAINLIHIIKPPKRTVFGSGLRVSFLRAWFFTAMKVLLIASLIQGASIMNVVEKNITLLDQYARNDFPTFDQALLPPIKPRNQISKVIVAQSFEPRGPATGNLDGSVASASTESTE